MTTPNSPIDVLSERYLDDFVVLMPTAATSMGITGHDHALPDYSPDGFEAVTQLARSALAAVAVVEPGSAREVVAKDAFIERLGLDVARYEAGVPQTQLNTHSSVPADIRQSFDQMPTATNQDWETIAHRLNQVGTALDGYRQTLLDQAARGRVAALRQVTGMAARIRSWTAADGDDYFGELAAQAPDSAVRPAVEAAASTARQAFAEFGTWLTAELAPRAPRTDASGREVYELASRYFLGADIDLDETSAWAWQELARIETEMRQIAAGLNGGDPSIESVVALLTADPERTIHGKDAFRDWMQELSDTAVAELSGKHFDIPAEIRTLECRIAPTSDGAMYYTPPSEDLTTRPGRMWWSVLAGVEKFATWREVTTVYHEGVPGHHLQSAQTLLRSDLLNRWQRLACWVSGHGEGWALYAERLMEELGYLEDPAARLGMLDGQAFRAARVVVDIGMHLELKIPVDNPYGWRPGEVWNADLGLEFLRAHSRMDSEFLEAELNRYLGWPGQAPSYKIGERSWLQARDEAKLRKGSSFDLRQFHSDALNLGSIGLDLLHRSLAKV